MGDLTERSHCYAVGALAHLAGEVTVLDGKIVATRVDPSGKPTSDSTKVQDAEATMLVAAYVAKWSEQRIDKDVAPDAMEAFLRSKAREAGLDVSKPFPFFDRRRACRT
jgi:alpha-acetolactate decarboxylase